MASLQPDSAWCNFLSGVILWLGEAPVHTDLPKVSSLAADVT
jgi:hypothetical protein